MQKAGLTELIKLNFTGTQESHGEIQSFSRLHETSGNKIFKPKAAQADGLLRGILNCFCRMHEKKGKVVKKRIKLLFLTAAGNVSFQDLFPISDYVMSPAVVCTCGFPHDQGKDI